MFGDAWMHDCIYEPGAAGALKRSTLIAAPAKRPRGTEPTSLSKRQASYVMPCSGSSKMRPASRASPAADSDLRFDRAGHNAVLVSGRTVLEDRAATVAAGGVLRQHDRAKPHGRA
jgi:hypothetical protein